MLLFIALLHVTHPIYVIILTVNLEAQYDSTDFMGYTKSGYNLE